MGNFYVYLTAFSAALGGFLFGYEIGIISIVLAMASFNAYFDIEFRDETGRVVVQGSRNKAEIDGDIVLWFLLGCMLGAVVVGFLADRIGRRISIVVGSSFFVVGAFLQTFANSLVPLLSGRFLGGVGIGILSMVVPLYIGETSPANIRGSVIAVQQLMITIGIFFANVINLIIFYTVDATSDFMWRFALSLQAVPGVVLFVSMLFMPYSPRWLAYKDRNDEVLSTLARMRRKDSSSHDVQEEYNHIVAAVQAERELGDASIKEFASRGIRKRLGITVVLQFFQQFTGINAIMYFAATLFLNMGFPYMLASTVPGTINALVNVLATFPGMYLVDRLGRRKLLVAGGICMSISMALVTIFTKLADAHGGVLTFSYFGALFIYSFVASFAFSWGPIVWVYQSEIFPLRVRSKGTAVGTFVNWASNAVVGKVTPLLLDKRLFGNYTYIIFACLGAAMASFVYFVVPETKGFSLEDMDDVFDSEASARFHDKVDADITASDITNSDEPRKA